MDALTSAPGAASEEEAFFTNLSADEFDACHHKSLVMLLRYAGRMEGRKL